MLRVHPGRLSGHSALIRLRFAERGLDHLAEVDRAITGARRDERLHHLKIMALHRATDGAGALRAIAHAQKAVGKLGRIEADMAIVASEFASELADAAFARVDPLSDGDLGVHWLRHLLRSGAPERVSRLHEKMPAAVADLAWPCLSVRVANDRRRPRGLARSRRLGEGRQLGADWQPLGGLGGLLPRLHVSSGQPLEQSVRGGTQTDGHLFSRVDPAIRALRKRMGGRGRDLHRRSSDA
jgi:hypothetical protein